MRVGLGYVLGVRADEVAALVAAREEGGPFRSLEDLASRAGAGRAALDKLAWSGACDALAGDRRTALWQLGVAAPGRATGGDGGPARRCRSTCRRRRGCARLDAWDEMIADYATTGISVAPPPGRRCCARRSPARRGVERATSSACATTRRVRIGGLVVARQRPGTAKGVVFLLLEDEHGTVNLVVPPTIYERDRLAVRSEPLVVAEGRVERFASAGGAINVLVDRLTALDAPGRLAAEVKELSKELAIVAGRRAAAAGRLGRRAGRGGAGGGGDFRAVAPPVLSFANGRRDDALTRRHSGIRSRARVDRRLRPLLRRRRPRRRARRDARGRRGPFMRLRRQGRPPRRRLARPGIAVVLFAIAIPLAVGDRRPRRSPRRPAPVDLNGDGGGGAPGLHRRTASQCHTLGASNAVQTRRPEPRRPAPAEGARRSTRSRRAAPAARARCPRCSSRARRPRPSPTYVAKVAGRD